MSDEVIESLEPSMESPRGVTAIQVDHEATMSEATFEGSEESHSSLPLMNPRCANASRKQLRNACEQPDA